MASPLRDGIGEKGFTMRLSVGILVVGLILGVGTVRAQDSLEVTFRYIPHPVFAELAFVPGSFNGWGI